MVILWLDGDADDGPENRVLNKKVKLTSELIILAAVVITLQKAQRHSRQARVVQPIGVGEFSYTDPK